MSAYQELLALTRAHIDEYYPAGSTLLVDRTFKVAPLAPKKAAPPPNKPRRPPPKPQARPKEEKVVAPRPAVKPKLKVEPVANEMRQLLARTSPHLQLVDEIPASAAPSTQAEVLILYHDESPEEVEMLGNLARAFSERVAPARLFPASCWMQLVAPKWTIATGRALAAFPKIEEASPFHLQGLAQYVQQPTLRRGLWTELVNAYHAL